MANSEHVERLKAGVPSWNEWRSCNSDLVVDLAEANLSGADLLGVNLAGANLCWTNLSSADLGGANLTGADLTGAALVRADLSEANLTAAGFLDANLSRTDLRGANLGGAIFIRTMLGDTSLSGVKGLESVIHAGPSTIGINTIYRSDGEISDKFLRNAGVPEEALKALSPLGRTRPPIQWHSCSISYSTQNEDFAQRLYSRMRAVGMEVWFAPEDLKGGKKLHEQLFEAIQIYDRLLLVLSEASLKSEWVMTEIRKAREVERKEQRRKLLPIRLVDFEVLKRWTCFDSDSAKDLAVELRDYFIPDFSNWKDNDAFEAAFDRLQGDLKADGAIRPD